MKLLKTLTKIRSTSLVTSEKAAALADLSRLDRFDLWIAEKPVQRREMDMAKRIPKELESIAKYGVFSEACLENGEVRLK